MTAQLGGITTTALDLARRYAARGWRPFPIPRGTKKPVTPWGVKVASHPTDQMLALWFPEHSEWNIGLATKYSRLLVLDEDTPGELDRLCAAVGRALPATYTVHTAAGRQLYFGDDEGVLGNRQDVQGYDIDVRGAGEKTGGFVVAAGSLHPDGVEYVAEDDHADVAPLPDWVREWLSRPEPGKAGPPAQSTVVDARSRFSADQFFATSDPRPDTRRFTMAQAQAYVAEQAVNRVKGAHNGTRNGELNNASFVVGHFVPKFWSYDAAARSLIELGLSVGLDADEVPATVNSGLSAGLREPYERAEPVAVPDDPQVLAVQPGDAQRLAVAREVERLRILDLARRAYAAELRPPMPPPSSTSLRDLLAEEPGTTKYRIAQLWPAGGKVLMSAPKKAGKTTLIGNLIRALADGARFLERPVRPDEWQVQAAGFAVEPLAGRRVMLLDFEMTRDMLREWLADQRITNLDAVHVELMRGRAWDIRDEEIRTQWAELLRSLDVAVLVVDPLGPIAAALGLEENDNTAMGGLLFALDALVREAGCAELFVVHHTGHEGERARGASALLGWPDAIWQVVRDEQGGRFFKAEGRDVFLPETALQFDKSARRLSLGEGNRSEAKISTDVQVVAEIVAAAPGQGVRGLMRMAGDTELGSNSRAQAAIAAAVKVAVIHTHPGPNRSLLHHPGPRCPACTELL